MPKTISVDIEQQAIELVKNEKTTWEEAEAFITEKVAFRMRNLIRQLRKNYWGVFDSPTDSMTNRKKIWIPLTETMVENVVKNIDLDTKDINFRAKKPTSRQVTHIIRSSVKNRLDDIFFGETLDEMERQLAIDGTVVWKTTEDEDDGKKTFCLTPVDILNCYIDPTAESIAKAYRFTERATLSVDQVKSMSKNGWINTESIKGSSNISRNDSELGSIGQQANTGKYVDVYECWGLIPKGLISGDKKDMDTEVEGRIVVSGLDAGNTPLVHLIEENKSKKRPYEEARYMKVSGRWYGRGVAEKLMMLQLYINTIVNIRINRSYVSQLGLFKIKKGAGITPQVLSRLSTNGAILVNSLDDIEQMVMQEASSASYKDEDVAIGWAQRITSAFEAVTGESLPSSTTATSVSIQQQSATSQFVFIKEGIGMFLQRWLKRQALPILAKGLTIGEIIRLTDDPEMLRAYDERLVNELLYKELDRITKEGGVFRIEDVEIAKQKAMEQLGNMADRFVKLDKKMEFDDYDVQVYVTNEEINSGVLVKNLMDMLQVAPEYRQSIVESVFDIMGLNMPKAQPQQLPQPGQEQQNPQGQPSNPQDVSQQLSSILGQSNNVA